MMMPAPTPLCPAGHLPLKGGDWLSLRFSQISSVAGKGWATKLPIFPLEGEMPGRAEGGVQAPTQP
ncbi:MAG: lytic murein transglycosylase [Mesorhizobium sp.]|nr:MAG: lytic murein transglycosylase [Mesorhizobium sp.]TJW06853.1 MAG: lytic murein transglycosylase [Mesorhizobium sp.]TJW46959.1 MAG: lytic murein transglycosylase [Mesorhizobium sp.]